ncbi:MAG: KilA-N domain-containing protein [Ekhidna sp.]|nr:KilA-N domain-containing protein [Ekhidna sp.]
MTKNTQLTVQSTTVTVTKFDDKDYICITDMAKAKTDVVRAADVIKNWIRTRSTLEFLGTWERIYNPHFKVVEFDHFKSQAGLPSFVLSPTLWVEKTNAIGIFSKAGRYGGTYADKDIAFEFGAAISAEFKIYLIKEFQRLKEEESDRRQLKWNVSRTLAKVNYHIHTDAIKEKLIPEKLTKSKIQLVYASEADLLNVALYGSTAKEWRDRNPDIVEGNIRDHSTIEQLVILSNMESINAMLIQQGMNSSDRLKKLNELAIRQMKSLLKINVNQKT